MKPAMGLRSESARTARCALVSSLLTFSNPIAFVQEAPVARFTTNPSPAHGEERLLVQFLDQSTGTITAWHWSFGDGATSGEQNPSHLYVGFGNFEVTLTVSGPAGTSSFSLDSAVELVAEPPTALGTMRVPEPAALFEFVADKERAIALGKALFWDVQLGSDGLTACASCHHHAGVDSRARNTLHPGANGRFDPTHSGRGGGPNTRLNAGDFPFTKFLEPNDGLGLIADTDDRRGTAGVLATDFQGVDPFDPVDLGLDRDDALFQVDGVDTLLVTGRDAPTAIGAIFFHRLFWDGRANHFFNGRNIWGNADPSRPAVLEELPDGSLGEVSLLLDNAAAASQAIGPPLSDVEMSWAGRSWPEVGRKLLARRPLASQTVHPADSVLGALADPAGPGLRADVTYAGLVRAAFHERWWGSNELTADGYTQSEANFALFFGLAIQCYEATLVPDQAPFDRFRMGDPGALTEEQLLGMGLFLGRGKCITCHDTPLFAGSIRDEVIHNTPEEAEGLVERMFLQFAFTSAELVFATEPGPGELPLDFNPFRKPVALYSDEPELLLATRTLPSGSRCPEAGVDEYELTPTAQVAPNAAFRALVRIEADGQCRFRVRVSFEWGAAGPDFYWYELEIGGRRFPILIPPASAQAVYDNGFYNIGVRASSEDPGVGGEGPFGPLSITRRVQRGEDVGQATHGGPVAPGERVAVTGAFKTPTLRNVELTGPYMHNGGIATLEQVIEFYARGTDFGDVNARDKDIDVAGFAIDEAEKAALVAFLESLTDPRVRHEQAPFDHPELPLKGGHVGDHEVVAGDALGNGRLSLEYRPATGASGGPALPAFIDRLAASITVRLVSETASTARVAFLCDKPPTSDVRVRVASSAPAVAELFVDELVFTPADWRVTRFLEIQRTAPGTGAASFTLRTARAQSTDPEFAGLVVDDLELDFAPATAAVVLPGPAGPTPAADGRTPAPRR